MILLPIKIGDFVTSCEAGYWQLIDIKPKIADEDYSFENSSWKKGDVIGQWAILKKAFTPKMKPKIDFSYIDASWLRPISTDVLTEIQKYFADNPDYKLKFDNADVKLRPIITNCWINLSDENEKEFRQLLNKLPAQFTMDDFWREAKKFKNNISRPPASHLINFYTYPWCMDKKANMIYCGCELVNQ